MSAPDRLDVDRLRAAIGAATIGSEIVLLESTESTNDDALELAKSGRPEGVVVFAEHQVAGRGQRGNKWESAAGKGLWFSIFLKPLISVQESARLTTWAADAVASTIGNSCQVHATVKPPNDLYIGRRKVAGVLVEMRAQPDAPHFAVLGIGLNVNQKLLDFPAELRSKATSLAIETNTMLDRNGLAIALLQSLDQTYRELFGSARHC